MSRRKRSAAKPVEDADGATLSTEVAGDAKPLPKPVLMPPPAAPPAARAKRSKHDASREPPPLPLVQSSPLRGMGAAPRGGSFSPTASSRGAKLLQMARDSELRSPSRAAQSPKQAFGISAVQTQPVAVSASLIPKRNLFAAPASTLRSVEPAPLAEVPHDPLRPLLDRFSAVETVLSMHRARGTTAWWSSVAASAATLTSEQPYSSELLRIVNGALPDCWPLRWALREGVDGSASCELVVNVPWQSGAEAELLHRKDAFARALRAQPAADEGADDAEWQLASLPDRPAAVSALPSKAMLGAHAPLVTAERRAQLAQQAAPAHLAHVDGATLLRVRIREEEARLRAQGARAAPVALEQLVSVAQQVRSMCRVSARHRWPLDVLTSKLLPDVTKAGAKDALHHVLERLSVCSEGWLTLVVNQHLDGGTYVAVAKDVKYDAMMDALRRNHARFE